jgi:tetratricopeptide (TPR) repeat protein
MSLLSQAASLRQAGRLAESVPVLRAALQLMPDNADLHHDLGLTLVHLGAFPDALACFERTVALNPAHGGGHLNRGKVLEHLSRPGIGEAYRAAVMHAPHSAEAHARLASVLEQSSKRGEAKMHYQKAAALSPPGSAKAHLYNTRVALIADDLDAAETALRALLAQEPNSSAALGMLGRVLNSRGAFAEAALHMEQALERNPRDVALYYNLVKTRRFTAADAALIARMQQAQALPAPALARMRLQHALAKALDDIGDYAGAAAALERAGALRAANYPMDRAALAALTDRMIALFTPAFLARAGHQRSASARPILVLGLPRSGTTLTETILARHSQVAGAGELGFWDSAGPALFGALRPDQDADMVSAAAQYLGRLHAASASAAFVVDKNPFNYRWALLAHLALPHARIIHCRRGMADNALSIMMAALRPQKLFGTSRDDLQFCVAEYERLMAHTRTVLPAARYYEVQYEKLVFDPEAETRAMLGFCGLPFEAACLSPEQDTRPVLTASVWQVRQPINRNSVGRWRQYEELLRPFRD